MTITTNSPANPAQGTWPLFIRKFVVDFVETGIAAIFALTLAFPTSVASFQSVATAIGIAVVGALVSAVRREAPDFYIWLQGKLGTN